MTFLPVNQDNAVGIATSYWLDDQGIRVPKSQWSQEFLLLHVVQTSSGSTQPPIQWVPGALSLWVKRLGCEADHSPATSVEVRKMWFYTFTPYMPSWHSAYLVKYRENFTLPLSISIIPISLDTIILSFHRTPITREKV
jgi:hypothetical protein